MFKLFVAEFIQRIIILAVCQRPNNSRSNLFMILETVKSIHVVMDVSDFAWIKQLKNYYGYVAENKVGEFFLIRLMQTTKVGKLV